VVLEQRNSRVARHARGHNFPHRVCSLAGPPPPRPPPRAPGRFWDRQPRVLKILPFFFWFTPPGQTPPPEFCPPPPNRKKMKGKKFFSFSKTNQNHTKPGGKEKENEGGRNFFPPPPPISRFPQKNPPGKNLFFGFFVVFCPRATKKMHFPPTFGLSRSKFSGGCPGGPWPRAAPPHPPPPPNHPPPPPPKKPPPPPPAKKCPGVGWCPPPPPPPPFGHPPQKNKKKRPRGGWGISKPANVLNGEIKKKKIRRGRKRGQIWPRSPKISPL